ncbi:tetratricopeptide repeat protein [Vineibacter terrae]|uniref:tetratricopeptide repeat protein n=1 Tax=Vineibacter terrae TaxID=2586908 RepID=UPI002E31607B|nr:tetratricopeptide repeat protein [Vineibacter terrae]HEX2889924.1 tetratricopeptide repeat protein [Vineibacter terrae]
MDKRDVAWKDPPDPPRPTAAAAAAEQPADSLTPLSAGAVIGKYRIIETLGQGAFGITYCAYDAQLHREVAIKEYLPVYFAARQSDLSVLPRSTRVAEDFRWGRERFLAEARTLARLERAAGIVNVYDFLEVNGTAYMVMELVRGETLEARLRRERRLMPDALEQLLPPLLDGLALVHEAGFLHRDIKPANILIDDAGRPTLIDFGAARVALQGRTQVMTAVYTPGYAAFEQFTSAHQGPWTDIYALGATLYHCAVGDPPPAANDRMIEDTLKPVADAVAGRHAPALLAAIDWAMQLKAADRPQSISAWREVLSGGALPVQVASARPTVRAAPMLEEVPAKGRGQARWHLWLAAGVIAAGLAGGGIYAWQRTEATAQQAAARKAAEEKAQADAEAKRRAEEAATRKAAEARARTETDKRQGDDATAPRQADAPSRPEAAARQPDKEEAAAPADQAQAHILRGAAYARAGAYDRAIEEYTQAIRLNPGDALAFYNRGDAFNAKGDYDHAIQDFTQAVTLRPDLALAFNGRGVAYDGKDDADRAIQDYNRAIQLKPDYAEAFYNRGRAFKRKGDDDRAIQDYTQAIRLKPDFAVAFNNRGNVYRGKGQYDRAIQDYDQAIRLDPAFTIALKNRGDVLVSKGDYDRAVQDYSEAIRIAPDFAVAFKDRGDVYYRRGDYARAIQDFSESARLDPQNAITWHGLCSARALAGQVEQALADCSESLRLRPGNAGALDSRGFAYLKLGDLDQAITDYDAALSIDAKRAVSLYGRGVARLRKGDAAGGNADIAAATAIDRNIAAKMRKFGIHP